MRWHDIRILYGRELRSALRERSVVVNSILTPILLYPLLIWASISGIVFVRGLAEGATSRVAVLELPLAHTALLDTLTAREYVEVAGGDVPLDEALARLQAQDLDAVMVFEAPPPEGRALDGNFQVRVHFDTAVDRSRRAAERVENAVGGYRSEWMGREARALGIDEAERIQYRVDRENVSSERQMGSLILGSMIPLFLVVSVALGCLVPSIDSTAGERERSTWETLMTVSASRMSVVTSKYLYVATVGAVAGILNAVAMFVSMGPIMAPLANAAGSGDAFSFGLAPMATVVMVAGAIVLSMFFAAAMMILASFARTFKDGQAMVMPVFYLALLPLIMGQQSDQTLTPLTAAIPVANVAVMVRDAINGVFLWPLIAEALAVGLVTVALSLLLARAVLRFEEALLGSYDGSFWRFLKERLMEKDAGKARAQEPIGD